MAILITQCLQNDFVKPIQKNEALPNYLHIGYEESTRLLGDNILKSPLSRFMDWANRQNKENLLKVHVRDWHDESDPVQKKHLLQFGSHCIKNTTGAEFIFEAEENDSTRFVSSTTLNDFEGTELKSILDIYRDENIAVGLIGVWTEAKILFLAYELSTRYTNFRIYICSALTASSSRSHHFLALGQLKRILGVQVIDSVGEFIQCLGGTVNANMLNFKTSVELIGIDNSKLKDEDRLLLSYLFRDCQSVKIKVLDGGFSGNFVGSAQAIDLRGYEQVQHVVKIGDRSEMAKERTAFEQIEAVLGNSAPGIAEFADFGTRGAIKYRYASMDGGQVKTLQSCFSQYFQSKVSIEEIDNYLRSVFEIQLGRFYRSASDENQDLLEYYCFESGWADSVRKKIVALIGEVSISGQIEILEDLRSYNLYRFYVEDIPKLKRLISDYPFCYVHGDLNGANVIIDQNKNTWIIDFFHTHHGHILKDFIKLENDLWYIYTPVESDEELKVACQFTDFVLSFGNPTQPEELTVQFQDTRFEKTYWAMKSIRTRAKKYLSCSKEKIIWQWLVAQLRYSVHTIGFDEPNRYQRKWALYTSCQLAKKIRDLYLIDEEIK